MARNRGEDRDKILLTDTTQDLSMSDFMSGDFL